MEGLVASYAWRFFCGHVYLLFGGKVLAGMPSVATNFSGIMPITLRQSRSLIGNGDRFRPGTLIDIRILANSWAVRAGTKMPPRNCNPLLTRRNLPRSSLRDRGTLHGRYRLAAAKNDYDERL